jgi:hypothetical protein
MSRRFVLVLFASSLLLLAKLLSAQPTVSLTRKTGAAAEPFSNVVAVEELPDGRVIVTDPKERTLSVDFRSGETRRPIADVFDASGSVVRRVSFPATHRVAGFGKGTVYLVRTDDDGLQWLERLNR